MAESKMSPTAASFTPLLPLTASIPRDPTTDAVLKIIGPNLAPFFRRPSTLVMELNYPVETLSHPGCSGLDRRLSVMEDRQRLSILGMIAIELSVADHFHKLGGGSKRMHLSCVRESQQG